MIVLFAYALAVCNYCYKNIRLSLLLAELFLLPAEGRVPVRTTVLGLLPRPYTNYWYVRISRRGEFETGIDFEAGRPTFFG